MTPKIATVIGGLRIALQALGAKMGVTLRIEGDQAYTNGSEIIIPTLPPDDHKAAVLARGYVDHESAHVRHSDFERDMGTWGELIEEVYIEKKQCADFPGCAINLRDMVGILKHEDGSFRGTKSQPMSLLTSWLVCRGRADVLGQPLGEVASEMETWSRQTFGDPFCDQFAACVARVGSCNTLDDCVNLGNEIEALITNPPPPRQKDKRPESGRNNQSDDAGNSDNQSPGGSESKDTSADSPRTSAGKQSDNLAGLRTADVGKATQKVDLGKMVAQMLGKEHTKGERTGNLEEIPDTHHPSVGAGSGTGDLRRIEGEMGFDDARRKTSRMRSQLAGLLQAVRLQQAVVFGGGFIGVDAALAMWHRGLDITLVHRNTRVLSQMTDEEGGEFATRKLVEKTGMDIRLKTTVTDIVATAGQLGAVRFSDDTTMDTTLLIMAIGVSPNSEPLRGDDKGVPSDRQMLADGGIYTAGDVAVTTHAVSGEAGVYATYPNAMRQARTAARHLLHGDGSYAGSINTNVLKKHIDFPIVSAGSFTGKPVTWQQGDIWRRVYLQEGMINGYIIIGDTRMSGYVYQLYVSRQRVDRTIGSILASTSHDAYYRQVTGCSA